MFAKSVIGSETIVVPETITTRDNDVFKHTHRTDNWLFLAHLAGTNDVGIFIID